ncbi:hypothetical protein [Dysgonomonas sp. 511]|uniref:hypothetical protein n=1 Tax=Dysgonomonas sp. 511 TaxID=2302930 RepID=UPI0013D44AB8|nr:hypothetical protein [Dysgonomonas sp. 511]NDV78076.1 hypothetical protein [Dysgonomonas sp. 511]
MYYNIAGYILKIFDEKLGGISSFSSFVSESTDTQPLLTVYPSRQVSDWDTEPLYQEDTLMANCQFLVSENRYLVRLREADDKIWLTEICSKGDSFIASSNIDHTTHPYLSGFSIWVAFGIAALWQQTVAVHASVIMHQNKSILFLGESGTGKSTHSKLWLKNIDNTELLNDDSPFVSIGKDGNLYSWGSPWSGKTPCYKNKQIPTTAFVRIRQAPFNAIKRLSTIEAIGALLPSLPPIFASDPTLSNLMHKSLSLILKQVPVYMLDCLPDADAAHLVHNTLKKDGWL